MLAPTSRSPVHTRTCVAIIEDHTLFAESLELALSYEGYEVRRVPLTGTGLTAAGLVSQVQRTSPRVAVLDLDLGALGDGRQLIDPLVRGGTNVVVLTASTDPGTWGECLHRGARKVISKNQSLSDILATVRRISTGFPVLDVDEREELLRVWQSQRAGDVETRRRLATLTRREAEVLGALLRGQSVREIARSRVVSEATVRTQVKSVLAKLGVSSQLAAVGEAYRVGWQSPC